jgi:hypothetical protein
MRCASTGSPTGQHKRIWGELTSCGQQPGPMLLCHALGGGGRGVCSTHVPSAAEVVVLSSTADTNSSIPTLADVQKAACRTAPFVVRQLNLLHAQPPYLSEWCSCTLYTHIIFNRALHTDSPWQCFQFCMSASSSYSLTAKQRAMTT